MQYTNKVLKNTIWITGCARSGTTMVGKILSSLKGVEYAFEPETLYRLLPLIDNIEKKYWNPIYEHYLIEDIFYNLCIGRKINLRKKDDSSIYNSINKKKINQKLNLSISRSQFETYLKKNQKILMIKIPDVARSFVKLQTYYPRNKFIVLRRDPSAVIASLMKKEWFKKNDISVPAIYRSKYWLQPGLYKIWNHLSEMERAKIHVYTMEKYHKKIKNKYIVDYEQLLRNPDKVIQGVCNFLNLKKTKKTQEMISQIDVTKI